MKVVNETPYPDGEVRKLVRSGMGRVQPNEVDVHYRRSPKDDRLGFTPFDHSQPVDIWVEPPGRYPQPGARSWRDEVHQTAAHEAYHYTHPHGGSERAAETRAKAAAGQARTKDAITDGEAVLLAAVALLGIGLSVWSAR